MIISKEVTVKIGRSNVEHYRDLGYTIKKHRTELIVPIEHLNSGLSYLMKDRGYNSVKELIGCALPEPITGFMDLSSKKKISAVYPELCQHCGNCIRCPYLAITLDKNKIPVIDPSKCIGCSLCAQKCFAKALYMKDRDDYEMELLSEC